MAAERTLTVDGLAVSEVLFYPDDGFPLCYGYMVGPDDGKSTLHPTPEGAVREYRNSQSATTSSPTGSSEDGNG